MVLKISEELPSSQTTTVKLGDDFQLLKRACMDQTNSLRECIQNRDHLVNQGKASTVEGIAASARVRRELNELAIVADRLHSAHEQMCLENRKRAKEDGNPDSRAAGGGGSEQGREVEELLKNVEACLEQERRRWGALQAAAASSPAKSSSSSGGVSSLFQSGSLWRPAKPKAAASGRGAGGEIVAVENEDLQQGLIEAAERDSKMENTLDAILSGLGRLKGVARDIEEEAVVQTVMLDQIQTKTERAEEELSSLNRRMEGVLVQAGGAGRLVLNVVLFLLLLALALFIFQTLQAARPGRP